VFHGAGHRLFGGERTAQRLLRGEHGLQVGGCPLLYFPGLQRLRLDRTAGGEQQGGGGESEAQRSRPRDDGCVQANNLDGDVFEIVIRWWTQPRSERRV